MPFDPERLEARRRDREFEAPSLPPGPPLPLRRRSLRQRYEVYPGAPGPENPPGGAGGSEAPLPGRSRVLTLACDLVGWVKSLGSWLRRVLPELSGRDGRAAAPGAGDPESARRGGCRGGPGAQRAPRSSRRRGLGRRRLAAEAQDEHLRRRGGGVRFLALPKERWGAGAASVAAEAARRASPAARA